MNQLLHIDEIILFYHVIYPQVYKRR